jgi:hypothetical protein
MNKPKFWNTAYPYRDFLLFSFNEKGLNENQLERIRKESSKINLAVLPQKRYGPIWNFVITQNPGEFTESNKKTYFSGVAQLNNMFYFGQKSIPLTGNIQKQLFEGIGNFTLIHFGEENIVVTQDFFGCGILFYFQQNDFFVISNRYHLLLLFLSWIGHKGRLNSDKVISTLYSNTTLLHKNTSSKMDIIGVNQLPFDHEVKVDRDGWKVVPKKMVKNIFSERSTEGYEELLRRGKEEVIDNIRSVFESNLFEKHITDLTGGRDSRAVLGAILNIEDAIKKIEVRTNDETGSLDLQIALGLTKLFGGKLYNEIGRPQHPITVEESFDIWRSYFMGTYHRLGLGTWSPKGENNLQIRFSGGCGEIYRTIWSKIYGNEVSGAYSIEELVSKLTNSFPRVSAYPYAQDRLNELLINELKEIPGETPIEKFNYHDLYFGNRYHFGMRAFEFYHDCPMWFPLLSKSLFRASRLLTFEERSSEKFMLELTERMNPLLIWIDYDFMSASSNKDLYNITLSDARFKGCNVLLDSDIDNWKAVNSKNEAILQRSREKVDSKFYIQWRDVNQYLKKETINAFYELSNYIPDIYKLLGTNFVNYIESLPSSQNGMYQICSKLNSLKDQIEIFS